MKKNTLLVLLFLTFTCALSAQELTPKFFPNPAYGDKVTFTSPENIDLIQIYDVMGKKVRSIEPKKRKYELDITDLNSGMYLVRIKSKNDDIVEKMILL